jgi:hypothetical protein
MGGYMINRIGHSLHETVYKEPEVGDVWGNNVIMAVYELYPFVYEVELDDFSTYIVEVL